MLSDKELRYLRFRHRLLAPVIPLSAAVVLLSVFLYGYCWFRVPWLAHPVRVVKALQEGSLPPKLMQCMATLTPMLFCASFFLIVALGGVMCSASVFERSHLTRLFRLQKLLLSRTPAQDVEPTGGEAVEYAAADSSRSASAGFDARPVADG